RKQGTSDVQEGPLHPFAENVVKGLMKVGRRAHRQVRRIEGDRDGRQQTIRFDCSPALPTESWAAVVTSAAAAGSVLTDQNRWKFSDSVADQPFEISH